MLERIIALMTACLLLFTAAPAEGAQTVATVNGEAVTQAEYEAQLSAVLQLYAGYGIDTTDETIAAYLADVALSELINDRLLTQDMTAKGVYDFTEAELTQLQTQAETAYARLVAQLAAAYAASAEGAGQDEDAVLAYARSALDAGGYSLNALVQYYQNDAASQKYADLLMAGETVTDAEVQAAYESRTEEAEKTYADDVPAFETALNSGLETWYVPEGYRNVLQILLRSEAEDKLSDTAARVQEILDRLAAGEAFTDLIRAYGEDSAFDDEAFFEKGYMVHRESVIWEPAFIEAVFSAEMAQPGDYTRTPVVSDMGVHILYYLSDRKGGPVPLTDDLREALRTEVYNDRANQKVQERLKELGDADDVRYAP